MLVNTKLLVAAILMFVAGCVLSGWIAFSCYRDLLFYYTAQEEMVLVERVYAFTRTYRPAGVRETYHDMDIEISLVTARGWRIVAENFTGLPAQAQEHFTKLHAMENSRVALYISDQAPRYFALELSFPWGGLLSLLFPLLLMVTPSSIPIVHFFIERKRKR
jgi:hypothetical protein